MPIKIFVKKLSGSLNNSQLQQFENKISRSKKFRQKFNSIEKIWIEAEKAHRFSSINPVSDWELVAAKIKRPFEPEVHIISSNNKYLIKIAAAILLVMGAGGILYKVLTPKTLPAENIFTYGPVSSVKEFILPDGSKVDLNAGSSFQLHNNFNKNSRELVLNGEAYFDVVHNASIPFRVFSGNSMVEVTGTRFSVRNSEKAVEVAVISGSVLLCASGNKNSRLHIASNQSGILTPDNKLVLENRVATNTLSWKTGRLVFHATPIDSALMDIAHQFRRNLDIEIPIHDSITAVFEHQPLNEILGELESVADLKFDTTGESLIVRK